MRAPLTALLTIAGAFALAAMFMAARLMMEGVAAKLTLLAPR